MPVVPRPPLLHQVKLTLGATNAELARHARVSLRTVQRWWTASGSVPAFYLVNLAAAVHPHDRDLAVRLAAAGGTTLEKLGIEKPPPPPSPSAAPPPVVALPPKARPEHADSVVYAAADALELAPKAVRPAIVAAFAQAQRLGLSVEALLPVLAAAKSTKGTSR